MKHGTYSALGASMLVAAVAGCQAPAPSDMTMQRGSQLLAAGSPKAAIPFLAQTIASRPDGPEPIALLALAYALDRQADRAILQAQQVHRPAGAPPGWETVAVGIAAMVQRRPADAQKSLERVLDTAGADSSLGQATMQWLALAQLLNGDRDQALETVQAQGGRSQQASAALVQCAAAIVSRREPTLEGETGGQSTYDSAVAAVAAGEMGPAQERFLSLQQDALGPADTAVWLAMISGSYGDWPESRTMLKEACRSSSPPARGLANQLFGVVCALEDRPDSMIEHILAGQRALGRHQTPLYITEPPKPESVWFSDFMK